MSAYDKYEDATLRKVFAVTLDPSTATALARPPVLYLEALSKVKFCRITSFWVAFLH